jgi:hypothetical protein
MKAAKHALNYALKNGRDWICPIDVDGVDDTMKPIYLATFLV